MEMKRVIGIAMPGVVLALIFCLMAPLPYAGAQIFSKDLTMQSTTTSSGMMGRGGGTTTSTNYYSKNALRTNGSDGTDTIMLFDSGKIISIDNNKKTYSEMGFAELSDMMNKATDQMGDKSEEIAAAMKMMGMESASFSISKVGPGETIAGYDTEKYILKGMMEAEIMAAPSLKIPSDYYDAMKLRMPSNPMFDFGKLFDEMKKIDGMPLKTVINIKVMNMEMKTTTEVTSIEKGDVPASVFEIPAGYTRVEPNLN